MASREKISIIVEAEDKASRTLRKIDGSVEDLGDTSSKTSGLVGGMKGALADVAIGAGVAGAAIFAAKKAFDMGKEGAQLLKVRDTFDALTDSIGETASAVLGDLRKATEGMVGDTDLMAAASKFLSMGLAETGDQASELARVAVTLGAAMGKDATGAMEEFALLLANQSIPRLDTFGISAGKVRQKIADLQAEFPGMTREAAFLEATMSEAAISMERLGDGVPVDDFTKFETNVSNLKDELSILAAEGLGPVVEAANNVVTGMRDQEAALEIVIEAVKLGYITQEQYNEALDNTGIFSQGLTENLQALIPEIEKAKQAQVDYGNEVGYADQVLRNYITSTYEADAALYTFTETSTKYFDLLEPTAIGQQDLNQKMIDAATQAGASAEEVGLLAVTLGEYSQEAVTAALKTAIVMQRVEELAAAYAAGDLTANDMRIAVKDLREELEQIEGDYKAHVEVTGLEHWISRARALKAELVGIENRDISIREQAGNPANRVPDTNPQGQGPPEFAHGGDFIVPGGGPFPMVVHPGERVQVTPASQVNNFNMTVNTAAQSSTVVADFRMMQAEVGR